MQPLVTIAIPAYKATYLCESIAAALTQTYQNIEVLVVNDCSPADIASIVKAFNDPRIRYFVNKENLGAKDPTANWNECLRLAEGEFFCLLCDDDLYAPTFVEELVGLSERHPHCNVFRSGVRVVDAKGTETDSFPASPEWETVEDYMWHIYRGLRRQTISEFMLRRSAVLQLGGYVALPYAWGSDYLSTFKFGLSGGIASTGLRLTTFRDSGANLSSDNDNMDDKLLAFKEYIRQTKEIIKDEKFERADDILPYIDSHYDNAVIDHMLEADAEAFFRIIANPKLFGVTTRIFFKYLYRKLKRR